MATVRPSSAQYAFGATSPRLSRAPAGARAVLCGVWGLALALILSACNLPPVDIETSLAISATDRMEPVSAFAVNRFWGDELPARDGETVFYPALLDPPAFGFFLAEDRGAWVRVSFTGFDETDDPAIPQPLGKRIDLGFGPAAPVPYTAWQPVMNAPAEELFILTAARGAELEYRALHVDETDDPSFVEARRVHDLYDHLRGAFTDPDDPLVAVAAGVTPPISDGSAIPTPAVVGLFDEGSEWRLAYAEPQANGEPQGLGPALIASDDLRRDAPLQLESTAGGELHFVLTGDEYTVFVTIPAESAFRTFRVRGTIGETEPAPYEEVSLSDRIAAMLSTGRLLVHAGNRYRIHDFDGHRRSQFTAGGLRFLYERQDSDDNRWYSYFSHAYWGRVDGEDYLFVRAYRIRTDRLGTLE